MGVPPPPSTAGDAPAGVAEIAGAAFSGLGLPGLVLAGGGPGIPPWAVAAGWADLDRNEILDTSHRFPVYPVAMLVTATAVLRLVGRGRLRLDAPASEYLHALRLADSSVTVRELLSHTGGVDSPAEMITTGSVPDLLPLAGGFMACSGTRGVVRPSAGGYAVLGQLIADTTGMPYADAVASLVLNSLGMSGSSIPSSPAAVGPRAVTGYTVTPEGGFAAMRARIATVPAGAGLWATAADLVRLGTGWSSLLPPALAREALTPQARPERGGLQAGLGWLISPRGDTAAQAGAGPGTAVSLVIRVRDNRTHVVLASRQLSIDRIDDALLRGWTNPAH
jgi:CubicO group peptidase (beta-lactamase class C family)